MKRRLCYLVLGLHHQLLPLRDLAHIRGEASRALELASVGMVARDAGKTPARLRERALITEHRQPCRGALRAYVQIV
jgi:hypothetical protein